MVGKGAGREGKSVRVRRGREVRVFSEGPRWARRVFLVEPEQ